MRQERPAGWYKDPDGGVGERYWDGREWTSDYRVSRPPRFRSLALGGAKVGGSVLAAVVAVGVLGCVVDRHSRVVDLGSPVNASQGTLVEDSAPSTPATSAAASSTPSVSATTPAPAKTSRSAAKQEATQAATSAAPSATQPTPQPVKTAPDAIRPGSQSTVRPKAKAAKKPASASKAKPSTAPGRVRASGTSPGGSTVLPGQTKPGSSLSRDGDRSLIDLGTAVCRVKGVVDAVGNRLYYLPGQPGYAVVRVDRPDEKVFCSVLEAVLAGFRPA